MPHSGTRGGSLTRLLEQEFPPDAGFRPDTPPIVYDPYRRASFPNAVPAIYEDFGRQLHLGNPIHEPIPVIQSYPYNPYLNPIHQRLPVVSSDFSERKCCLIILVVLLVFSIPMLMFLYESSKPLPKLPSNQ